MKIIFLDIDGVMNNSHRGYIIKHKNFKPEGFDPIAVAYLKQLIEETDSKIVICSSWRICIGTNIEWWNGLFAAYGIYKLNTEYVWGLTPNLFGMRGEEVASYIKMQNEDLTWDSIEKYVILDDSTDYYDNQPLIRVNNVYGLNRDNIEAAKLILNG